MKDRRILYAASFLRALATGLIGVLLGFYLAELQFDASTIGMIVTAGLVGATAATFFVTLQADQVGHRKVLIFMAFLAGVGGFGLAASSGPLLIGATAFLGMVNGMGRDRGAAMALEQALLPATVSQEKRTFAFAVYNLLQDIGHALGGLLAAIPAFLEHVNAPASLTSSRSAVGLYAVLSLAPSVFYMRLSSRVEPVAISTPLKVSLQSRKLLWRISSLFALDSLGGGFITTTLLSYFFHERFGVTAAEVGPLVFGARIANALSHLGAAWIARKIGLLNTMVFTHIPSSVLLVTVAIAPSFPVAAVLFLLREGLVEMDVPTRQSYVMPVVHPRERTVASGITQLVRLGGWAVAPAFAGVFMDRVALITPLVIAAAMKIAYDLLLYSAFRRVRPPEERG